MKTEARICVEPKRHIGVVEYGSPKGAPLLFFHGAPGAHPNALLLGSDDALARRGVRLIALDRPGCGLSDFQPGRTVLDWPRDVVAVADALGLDRFAILAHSGGSSYVAACALKIPERITAAGIAGVVAPFEVPGVTDAIHPDNLRFIYMSRDKPFASRTINRVMSLVARLAPDKMIAQVMSGLPPPDQASLAVPAIRDAFLDMYLQAQRKGPRGAQHDVALMASPWGFDLGDIPIPLHLWHGAQDKNAPAPMAEHVARAIKGSRLKLSPDDGHVSIAINHADEILATLLSSSAA